jgi:uncharacterized protein
VITIDTVLLKIASRCNLDCTYCYVYQMGNDGWKSQPKKMDGQTLTVIAQQLAKLASSQKRGFSVVFHGGEPLLVGADRFERMCRTLRQILPEECALHLQTNGMLLSEAILQACFLYDVGISISVDGPREVHDASRVDRRGRGSHERVLEGVRRLVCHPHGATLFTGVLAVVDIESDPVEVYEFLKSTGAPSIDFLYRDGNHDVLPIGKATRLSIEYGEWMARLLDYYLDDQAPTPIRFLDDMIKILIGGIGRKEGVGLNDYGIIVFETDGTITKNDTLKSVSASADQFDARPSALNCDLTSFVNSSIFNEYHQSQRPASSICKKCSYLNVCGGGMPSHRFSTENGLSNPTVFCADQQYLIERIKWHVSQRKAVA